MEVTKTRNKTKVSSEQIPQPVGLMFAASIDNAGAMVLTAVACP